MRRVVSCLSWIAVMSFVASSPAAEPSKSPEFKLPAGWTAEDLQACRAAGTPGKMHEQLAQNVGTWEGTSTMWHGPDSEPVKSACSCTCTPMMDGRFFKTEFSGEMPGMGPYNGFGLVGFDNVAQKFAGIWIDNHGTGMMTGTGEASDEGKTINWTYAFNCPITKKQAVMREVETMTGPNTKTLEMFGADPKSGKEYQMMKIELTKK